MSTSNSLPPKLASKLKFAVRGVLGFFMTSSQVMAQNDPPELVWEELGARVDESTVRHVLEVGPEKEYDSLHAAYGVAHGFLSEGEPVKIRVDAGLYRESLGTIQVDDQIRDTLLVIEGGGAENTVWSGSNLWEAAQWTHIGEGLYVADWPHAWGNFSMPWETPHVLGHRSEMVFVDGELMTQVLLETYEYDRSGQMIDHGQRQQTWTYTGLREAAEALPPGTFGVTERPENGGKLFLRLPEGKKIEEVTVEVSERRNPFTFDPGNPMEPGKNNFVLRGIPLTHFASRTKNWGAEGTLALGRNVRDIVIENCVVEWNNARGINIHARHVTLKNNIFRYNGFGGIGGEAGHSRIVNNTTNYNNWRGAWGGLRGWNWGGVKFGGYNGSHHWVRGHEAIGNLAPGFWYDIHPQNIIVEDLVAAENDGLGLFLELSAGPFVIRRALLARNLNHQFKATIVGSYRVEDSILYSNLSPTIELKGTKTQRSLAENLWYLRSDEHARQHEIVPGRFHMTHNIFLAGGELTTPFSEHIGINRQHPHYSLADKAYQGEGNLFHSENGGLDFAFVQANWQVRATDLEGWQSHTRERDPVLTDPGFVDPAGFDFRLKPDSPLQDRAERLPTRIIDPAKIAEARRFRKWVTLGIALDGRNPGIRVSEE